MISKYYFITTLMLSLALTNVFAQVSNNNSTSDNIINNLVSSIQSNPDNPLGMSKAFLLELSQQIKNNPQLQNNLQSYINNIGTDKDLSYRQIYHDLSVVFGQNPALANNNAYSETAQKLNLIFDNYNLLSEKMKSSGSDQYKLGMFVNDPSLISGLTNLTGSPEAALGIGLGVEMLSSISSMIASQQKYKIDYSKLAKLSIETQYAEKDPNLNSTLIDACILNGTGTPLTPIFRYDFNNGATLRVENGILKYVHANKGITKSLFPVQKRHNGNFSNPVVYGNYVSFAELEDNNRVRLTYWTNNKTKKKECDECLDKGSYWMNIENGEINEYIPVKTDEKDALKKLKAECYYDIIQNEVIKSNWFTTLLANTTRSWFLIQYKVNRYSTSLLVVDSASCRRNNDIMSNEITQIAWFKKILYYATADGRLGKLNRAENITVDNLTEKLRSGLGKKSVASYDFTNNKTFTSAHGITYLDVIYNTTTIGKYETLIPSMDITPDGKHLVYVVKDSLFIINPDNLEDVRRYGLTMQPYNFFFTRENNEWVLNLQARNEYSFPIIKKYSLSKLASMDQKKFIKTVTVQPTSNNITNNNNVSSLADEIKKLKGLLDDGIITQEEFTAAKGKLLNGNSGTASDITSPKADLIGSTLIINNNKLAPGVISFSIKEKSFCAVKNSDARFHGLYKYLGKEPRFWEYAEGEPIIKLDSDQTGRFQNHGVPSLAITWWLESDCNGNIQVENGVLADRYTLVIRFEESGINGYPVKGNFDRVSLDVYKDGNNKIVILGERVKQY